jgi:hypothetical protein
MSYYYEEFIAKAGDNSGTQKGKPAFKSRY